MPSVTVHERFRPARIAFVIPAGDQAAFEQAIRINTALLGGMFNPIVPFTGQNQEEIVDLLRAFDPDLVHSDSGVSITWLPVEFKRQYPEYYRRLYGGRNGQAGPFVYQDVAPIINEMWKEVARIDRRPAFVFPVLPTDSPYHLFFKATFGAYPQGFSVDYEREFKEFLNAFHLPLTDLHPLQSNDPDDRMSPIQLTIAGLHQYCPNRFHPSRIIYAGEPTELDSLIDFWNLRAAGNQVFFLPIGAFERYETGMKSFVRVSDSTTEGWSGMLALARSTPSETRNAIKVWLASTVTKRSEDQIECTSVLEQWKALPVRMNRYAYTDESETLASISEGAFEYHTAFPKWLVPERPTLDEKFLYVSPSIHGLFAENKFLTVFPPDPGIERDLSRIYGQNGRIANEGLSLLRSPLHRSVHCQLPTAEEAIQAIFKFREMTISMSEPGHVAKQVISRLGGIGGCRVLKVPAFRAAIDLLNDGKAQSRNELLRTIGKSLPEGPDDLYVEPDKLVRGYKPAEVVDLMHRLGMIEQGWQLKCRTCSMYGWYPLGALTANFECQWCFASQPTPLLDCNPQVTYAYRANGLYLAQKKMKGSIPVIITLWRLGHAGSHFDRSVFVTSVEVRAGESTKKNNAELDFVVLITESQGSSDYRLVLGEARGKNDYGEDEISKVRRIANRFGQAFVKKHLVLCFSTLKDEFSGAEKVALRSLVRDGYEVLPLTRLELDPYDLFERFNGLPNQYSQTMEHLAANARALNLKS